MEATRVIVFTAVAAVCLSVLMSVYFTRRHKQEMKKMNEEATTPQGKNQPNSPMSPPPPKKKPTDNSKGKRGTWAGFMLPFYSLGILAYIGYVVGKIMSKKYSNSRKTDDIKVSWNRQQRPKGNTKTKITMHELRQLEQRLQETEEAVKQIFSQTCLAAQAANKALDSATSSEDEVSIRPTKAPKKFLKPNTESTEDRSSHSDEEISPKSKMCQNHYELPTVRRRRMKRSRRKFCQNKRGSLPATSSSEGEDNKPSKYRDVISHHSRLSDENVNLQDLSSVGLSNSRLLDIKPAERSEDRNEEAELLKTAKDVRKTVSELQSYLEDKKAEFKKGQ